MKKLKIAQIAPLSERVPPKKYGGTERVVHALTEELVKRGHEVTLFASGDSSTSAKLSSVYPRGLREAKIKDPHGLNEWVLLHLLEAYKREDEFDIIHEHNSIFGLSFAQFVRTPVLVTIHGPIRYGNRRLFETAEKPHYVTISDAQGRPAPELEIAGRVYNGLNMEHYPFRKERGEYLLYVGRISMEKGVHHAIDVSNDLNLPLVIAAKLDEIDVEYFNEYIEPKLYAEQIQWVGEVDEIERNRLMSNALCLLHPVVWREPFGLTLIEAMACGCPVIGFSRGSIPEIIVDGKTGFVVDDVEGMIEAVLKVDSIKREDCREYALKNFNEKRMADGYEDLYYKILDGKI